MGYKKMKQNFGFADVALASSMKRNRNLKNMQKLNQSIDWNRINTIFIEPLYRRLVRSANRPISNNKIKKAKHRHNTPEGNLYKNG
jgi:hypothetical protein